MGQKPPSRPKEAKKVYVGPLSKKLINNNSNTNLIESSNNCYGHMTMI